MLNESRGEAITVRSPARDVAVPARQRLVWSLLADAVADAGRNAAGAPRVLDCGGGTGTIAVLLAGAGADVTVVDVSVDALSTTRRRAVEAGVSERVHVVQADVESLVGVVAARSFDLVLGHGILEAVDHIDVAFGSIVETVRPGGLLSVLVSNPVAAVFGRAVAGDPVGALAELREIDTGGRPANPAAIRELCERVGLVLERVHGVGVFGDLVPGSALDVPGASAALAELEGDCAVRAPFAELAARVHLLARRPG